MEISQKVYHEPTTEPIGETLDQIVENAIRQAKAIGGRGSSPFIPMGLTVKVDGFVFELGIQFYERVSS